MGIISSKQQQQASLLAPSMAGELEEVKRLVGVHIADAKNESGGLSTYVDASDPSGNAAIHAAVFSGHLDVLSFLVEKCGADLTRKNGLGCSPLWIAAGYDRLECLEYLIEKLHDAEQLGSALLDDGKNNSGDTPFLAASSKGNLKACECLLRAAEKCGRGDDDRRRETKARMLRSPNDAGDTPLKVAVASSQGGEMLTFLLRIDGEISSIEFGDGSSSNQDEEWMGNPCVDRKNNAGLSPLIVACERNLPKAAELLLEHGADICIRDDKGRNSLAIAAFCGCNDVVEFLLGQSSNKALLLDQRERSGRTPLWLAARTGNLSVVELLVDAGADVTIRDDEGLSPRDVAAKFKKDKVEEYLAQQSLCPSKE